MRLSTKHQLTPPVPRAGANPTRPRRPLIPVAIAAALVLLMAGTFAWRQGELRDRDAAIAEVVAQRDAAQQGVTGLSGEVDRLRTKLDASATGRDGVARDLVAARAQLERMLGPVPADGRSFGELIAVGADQDPPRVVIDLEQWFTDQAADEAASQDGELPPGERHVPNGYYIRNVDPRWRMLPVDPAAPVSLTTYPFGQIDQPLVVTFQRFADLFASHTNELRWYPYWITVRDGRVVAIDEQYIP